MGRPEDDVGKHVCGGRVSGDRRLPAARTHTDLTHRYEREAEEFARALLIDEGEALREGLVGAGRDD